jgi:hypothetical protein
LDTAPDRDRRYRVNDFFCHQDTWQMVVSRLLPESDVTLMDLRSFSKQNAGCIFEINSLAQRVSLNRVVFLVDQRTDEQLLQECLGEAGGHHRARIIKLRSVNHSDLRRLLATLAATAGDPAQRVETSSRATEDSSVHLAACSNVCPLPAAAEPQLKNSVMLGLRYLRLKPRRTSRLTGHAPSDRSGSFR